MTNTRKLIPDASAWLLAALVVGSGLSISIAHAAAQSDVPAPPAAGPAPAPVIIMAPQPQPQPQTVYVQPAPQYGGPGYAQSGYMEPAPQPSRGGSNRGMIIGGAVMLGVGWVLNIVGSLFAGIHVDLFGSGSGGSTSEWEAFRYTGIIPVVGPWIQLGIEPAHGSDDAWGAWLIIDGLLQAAGLTLLIVGIATSGGDDEDTAEGEHGIELAILPTMGPDHAGLSALGRF